jgi:hypothetical protein
VERLQPDGFFNPDPNRPRRSTTEQELLWMQDWGFDFIRLPMAYPYYLKFDRSRTIKPEEVYQIDERWWSGLTGWCNWPQAQPAR